jgi:hypothetical protein
MGHVAARLVLHALVVLSMANVAVLQAGVERHPTVAPDGKCLSPFTH